MILLAQLLCSQKEKLPVIDMHMHAIEELCIETGPCFPKPCEKAHNEINKISELLRKTIEIMDEHHIVMSTLSSHSPDDLHRRGNTDNLASAGI